MITCHTSSGVTAEQVAQSGLYQSYVRNLSKGWRLLQFDVKSAVVLNGSIILASVTIKATDASGEFVAGDAFLRGETVEILPVLQSDLGDYVPLIEQSRVPVGRSVLSTPAGMVNDSTIEITVLSELEQELGRKFDWTFRQLMGPMYVSPGGSDESVTYFVAEANVSNGEMASLQDTVTGEHDEGEFIVVKHLLKLNSTILQRLNKLCTGQVNLKTHHLLLAYLAEQRSIPLM